jgi:UMF1 family MFS transporter
MGPLIFGLTLQFSGSYRLAILSIALFFALGLIILTRVNIRRAIVESGNEVPHGV